MRTEPTLFDSPPRQMHENSLAAYRSERANNAERARMICEYLRNTGQTLTDRQIMKALGFDDKNKVSPRITESIQAGLLIEVDNVKDEFSGKTVRRVKAI